MTIHPMFQSIASVAVVFAFINPVACACEALQLAHALSRLSGSNQSPP
jgi:hypothetical protein